MNSLGPSLSQSSSLAQIFKADAETGASIAVSNSVTDFAGTLDKFKSGVSFVQNSQANSLFLNGFDITTPQADGADFDPGNGQLRIIGTSANDSAVVNLGSGGQVSVSFNGQVDNFDRAPIREIVFIGKEGADFFRNNTDISVRAYGNDGNDTLVGGSAADRLIGGVGNDEIRANNGDDFLKGGAGNDSLSGGGGHDRMIADAGTDSASGGAGHDFWAGGAGQDSGFGDGGKDRMIGGDGNDRIFGGAGNDVLLGQAGLDFLVGDEGNDRVLGGVGNDQIQGGVGDDFLKGELGSDEISGDAGNDTILGDEGNDNLFGDNGRDRLVGGAGLDGLFGGDSIDQLVGGLGADRFLEYSATDDIRDLTKNDAKVIFERVTSNWTDKEIKVVDAGLQKLHRRTKNTVLLKNPLATGELTFYKYKTLGEGVVGENFQRIIGSEPPVFEREIRLAEWNENDEDLNHFITSSAIHEIGHSWDSTEEIVAIAPRGSSIIPNFLTLSSWRDTDPNNSQFTQSGDGNWWYLTSSSFARGYGRTNPFEDFSSVWEYYFDNGTTSSDSNLNAKLDQVDNFFDVIQGV